MPSSVPKRRTTNTEKRRTEINLSGPGSNWTVHFARKGDLSDSISFTRGGDNAQFVGTSRHTLSIFSVDGGIKFRDSRTVAVRRRNREGQTRNSQLTVCASVEINPREFEVLRHEQTGNDWITLIKLRPGRIFVVRNSPTPNSDAENPLPISHDMLRLRSRRSEIQAMQYLALVIRDHRNYIPWTIVLQRKMLGPVVKEVVAEPEMQASAAPIDPPAPVPSTTETREPKPEPLIDLGPEEVSSALFNFEIDNVQTPPPVDLFSDKPTEEPRHDPFRGIWEHAAGLAKFGKDEGEKVEA